MTADLSSWGIPETSRVVARQGDFLGESIRVGAPTYHDQQDIHEIMTVINEPPKHYDVVGGTVYDLNNNGSTYASFLNEVKLETNMTYTAKRSWGASSKISASLFKIIKASLEASYGEDFEYGNTVFSSSTFGQQTNTRGTDAILAAVSDYWVWEYPVYDSDGAETGHIVVVWPHCHTGVETVCDPTTVAMLEGDDPVLNSYLPNHENHNILSYRLPSLAPVAVMLHEGQRYTLGQNEYQAWFKHTDITGTQESDTSKLKFDASTGVEGAIKFFGFGLELKGDYEQSDASTHALKYEQTTEIQVYFASLNQAFGAVKYNVQPLWYWDTSGALVLDYDVAPEIQSSPPSWWQQVYTRTDPAFRLPWKYDPSPERKLYCREVVLTPATASAGETVTVEATVHNYSWYPVSNVKVQFYDGHPEQGGTKIGTEQTLTLGNYLDPVHSGPGDVTVHTTFAAPATTGAHSIYAVIDPAGVIDESHEDNNLAYSALVVTDGVPRHPEANIWIEKVDWLAEPVAVVTEQALGSATIHMTATIMAEHSPFTWVTVAFYAGDFYSGQKNWLGGEVIPLVLPGDPGVPVHFAWDTTDHFGDHDIWVEVRSPLDADLLPHDNRMIFVIQLEPVYHYLPIISKNSSISAAQSIEFTPITETDS